MNGLLKQLISSIRWFRENLIIGWATMDQKKLKIIHGFVIFLGKISMKEKYGLHSFHL